MARPRSRIQRERDLQAVAELRLKGWSQQKIADYLEIDISTVCRDIQRLEARWKEKSIRDFDAERQMQLDRLEMLESEYWSAWERSQGERESSIAEEVTGAGDTRLRSLTRTQQVVGDPQFLAGIGKCIAERSKLLGLYVETKGDREPEDTLKDYFNYLAAKDAPIAQLSSSSDPPDSD